MHPDLLGGQMWRLARESWPAGRVSQRQWPTPARFEAGEHLEDAAHNCLTKHEPGRAP